MGWGYVLKVQSFILAALVMVAANSSERKLVNYAQGTKPKAPV